MGVDVGAYVFAFVAVAPTLSVIAAVVIAIYRTCCRPKERKKRKKAKKLED